MNTTHFIKDNFLLYSKEAETLYHGYAKDMPIIDYHNHLSPKQIAEDLPIGNITDAWLSGDHYKWRAMRANGIEEKFITGDSSKADKFDKWAVTAPHTLRNPLFHWTQLELKRYFDIDEILQPSTATAIYEKSNAVLAKKTPAKLLEEMNVEVICTTDDPLDNLEYHKTIANKNIFTKVLPTFRPDALLLIENDSFYNYLKKLERGVGFSIDNLDNLLDAIESRIEYFNDNGCRLSDYGLAQVFAYDFTEKEADSILKKRINGDTTTKHEANLYASCILFKLCKMYHSKGWVQQFHLGALRNNNSRLLKEVGADVGCDSIGDFSQAESMSKLFNRLDFQGYLSKTIVYNLNPSQNEVFATMMGNYSEAGIPGKMQYGSGWWFLDQKEGMEKQLNTLSNMGLLSRFVGMLTDSRSFLSFPRHEYFRRILCNLMAEDIKKGLVPNDILFIGKMIQDICYYNAKRYFKI
ncbi:glucuronate isomerase [Aureibaculum conchae]|uniref:glucuronate isomerase n=1 Tax=Aureibaculum sp. 2308TA14-22 TaxID=3108392 RepID=UPI0033973B1B